MKLRRQARFHGLKRPKVRQTWNKYNLYNLSRMRTPKIDPATDTFFQQKWKAKAMMRAYHGEHVSEHRWARLFSRRINSVVPMNPKYMAQDDGSIEATGRGSGRIHQNPLELFRRSRKKLNEGRDNLTGIGDPKSRQTPYMNMAFAPLERRLDIAIFRAMFASSARQARNFVIHGHVKVNGIKVDKPSYMLNPGDMFQVDPDMVMYATGVQRGQDIDAPEIGSSSPNPFTKGSSYSSSTGPSPLPHLPASPFLSSKGLKNIVALREEAAQQEKARAAQEAAEEVLARMTDEERAKDLQKKLKDLLVSAKTIIRAQKDEMNATKKRRLRSFREDARLLLQRTQVAAKKGILSDADLMDELSSFLGNLTVEDVKEGVTPEAKAAAEEKAKAEKEAKARAKKEEAAKEEIKEKIVQIRPDIANIIPNTDKMSLEEHEALHEMLLEDYHDERRRVFSESLQEQTPVELEAEDPDSKPYKYPWRPRPWMPAFAIIPRYLEVNPLICAAVYIRHPVARPGRAEVPTPFPEFVNALAFNYYLRRR